MSTERHVRQNDPPDAEGARRLVATVAGNVRRIREGQRWSLSQLAQRAGIAKATLSQLESGRASPGMETIWALATALGVPFGDLITEPSPAMRVVRAGEGVRVDSAVAGGFLVRLIASGGPRGRREIYVVDAEPGIARDADPHPVGVTEHLYVVRGAMRVTAAAETVDLAAGDIASFPADVVHSYAALRVKTRALLVMEYPAA